MVFSCHLYLTFLTSLGSRFSSRIVTEVFITVNLFPFFYQYVFSCTCNDLNFSLFFFNLYFECGVSCVFSSVYRKNSIRILWMCLASTSEIKILFFLFVSLNSSFETTLKLLVKICCFGSHHLNCLFVSVFLIYFFIWTK